VGYCNGVRNAEQSHARKAVQRNLHGGRGRHAIVIGFAFFASIAKILL
jgi:hypothetical protein